MDVASPVRRDDVDGALAVVAEASRPAPMPFTLPVVERLLSLLRSTRGGYYEFRLGDAGRNLAAVECSPVPSGKWGPAQFAQLPFWPLRDVDGCERPRVGVLSHALPTPEQREHNPFSIATYKPIGVRDEMKLWLPAPPGEVRAFWFTRQEGEADFCDRELELLRLVAPYLADARSSWRGRRLSLLTGREREVLRLVAEGLTNAEVARRLGVASGTVRSHLDHIYEKLGVTTRTAAAAAVGWPSAGGA